jgi:CRP-like cAMP-binding protein
VLSVKVQTESNCVAAMAYFLLAQLHMGRANLAYQERMQDRNAPEDLYLLTEIYQAVNAEQTLGSPNHFEKFLLLATSPVLDKINIEKIADIARNSKASAKRAGDVIAQRGELLQSVHLLYEGVLGLEARGKSHRDIVAGEFIGLASVLSGKPFTQTVRVVSAEARILSISSEEIIHLIDTDHQIASTLLRILAETL